MRLLSVTLAMLLLAPCAQAQVTLSNDKPVQISSDMLDVQQDKRQAIFSGNVIATQGNVNMRADEMIVHYRSSGSEEASAEAAAEAQPAKGVERIDAKGNVVFSNSTDTAKGDAAVYMVDAQTLDLTGDVLLTRDKNILKGTRLNYNLSTGRSILTAGGGGGAGKTKGAGRVHGLFVPESETKK